MANYEKASSLFREAIRRSKDHFPASHNNLGVTLALLGHFSDAEREFEIALEQSSSKYDDAVHNLALCRSRLNSARVEPLALTMSDLTTR